MGTLPRTLMAEWKTEEIYWRKKQELWRIKQGSNRNQKENGRPEVTEIDYNTRTPN